MEYLQHTILANSLLQWLIAATALATSIALLWIARQLVSRRLAAFAERTATHWDDAGVVLIEQTKLPFIIVVGIFVGAAFLQLPERIQSIVASLLIIALLLQVGIWGMALIAQVLDSYRQLAQKKNRSAVTTINVIGLISKIVLWSIVVLLALDNLGVNVTALVAGLGIGGVAVALALQNILGDLFASLSIMFDKPFVVGDFIIVGDLMGSVEHIGVKTTRIHSLSGEQLVFSNSDLLNSRIRNFGRMFERRVVFSIGVTYDTPREKLKRIPHIIQTAVESQNDTRFDRAHFMKYGDYALLFETVFYVLTPDYNTYMDIQQEIYFAIHAQFEQADIHFAYPTQKLFVTQSTE